MKYRFLFLLCTCSMIAAELYAQPFANPLPFALPLRDSLYSSNLLIDQPPIGIEERLMVKDGHFVRQDGERVRLMGTTLSYSACYPDSIVAMNLARRFHDLGINAVRLRGWDITVNGGYLLPYLSPTTDTTFSSYYLNRLDWFIYQLKKNGVYVYLSNFGFLPQRNDGVVGWDSIQYSYNVRCVQFFNSAFQQAHKKFLKRLLTHINPYTKVMYKDEPTLALTALTDENSLVYYWSNDYREGVGGTKMLSYHLQRHIDTLFNVYLKKKYSSDANLRAAWTKGTVNPANIARDPGFEDAFSSPWTLNQGGNGSTALLNFSDADKVEGAQSARIRIQKPGSYSYDIQLAQAQIAMERGKQYKMTYWAKTSAQQQTRPLSVYLVRGESPYNSFGLSKLDTLTAQWKQFSTIFTASESNANTLLIFAAGGYAGDVYVDNVSLTEQAPLVLRNGESLSTYSVSTMVNRTELSTQRIYETAEFMNLLTAQYYDSMTRYLRDTLKCSIIIGGNGTNMTLNDAYTARNTGFTAYTSYWGYFLQYNGSADSLWALYPQPNVESNYGGVLSSMVRGKVKGVPHIINNFFQSYPTANYNELLTYLPAYAAFQDWDAFFLNEWSSDVTRLDSASITKFAYYELKNQNALLSLAPAAARAWKQGMIAPGEEAIRINHIPEQRMFTRWQTDGYYLPSYADSRMPYFRRVELDSFDAKYSSFLPHLAIPDYSDPNGLDMSKIQSDTKQIWWNQVDGWLKVTTPRYLSITGKMNKSITDFDGLTIEKTDANVYGTLTWVSADTTELINAPRSLLTISSRSQNKGAIWGGDTTLWKGWGAGPVEVEALTMRLSLKSDCDTLLIYPLDERGRKTDKVFMPQRSGSGRYNVELDQRNTKAMWYLVEQRRRDGGTSERREDAVEAQHITLSPNPTNDVLYIDYPQATQPVSLRICNAEGRVVEERQQAAGTSYAALETTGYSAGVYIVTMRCGSQTTTAKFVVVR